MVAEFYRATGPGMIAPTTTTAKVRQSAAARVIQTPDLTMSRIEKYPAE